MREMIMYSRVTVEPTSEPVTIQELKAQLNIDIAYEGDDIFLISCLKAARQWVEYRIGQSIMQQTRVQTFDKFPWTDYVELLYGPVSSVTSITYVDTQEQAQTFSASSYWFDRYKVVPRVVVKINWPSTGDTPGACAITYVAGMTTVPESLKAAIKLLAAHFYENRVPETQGVIIGKLGFAVEALCGPHIVHQNSMIYVER